jgi:TolB protein
VTATQAPPAQDGGLVVDVVGGTSAPLGIAIPVMPTAAVVNTPAGPTDKLGRELSRRSSPTICATAACSSPIPPTAAEGRRLSRSHRAPFEYWGGGRGAGAGPGLCPRQWRRHADGRLLSLRRRLAQSELTRRALSCRPADWRRAAHKCADMRLCALTGEGPYFDSRSSTSPRPGPRTEALQAARDHGPGRREPPLPDQRPVDRADPALLAEPARSSI